jgi:uncharacterized membrane protein (DUF106 family)
MLETINNICLVIMDPVMNWLLYLPRDVAIFVVAIATSAILTFIRIWTTNQDLLARCKADKTRIGQLMKEAKKDRDKEAIARYRGTTSLIAMKLMRAEGKPLLAVLLPVALLATWCFSRIGFHPPQEDETVTLNAFFPATAIGKLAHIVPREGLEADRWIARVEPTPDAIPGQEGEAVWKLRGKARPEDPYKLGIKFEGGTYEMELLVGSKEYSPNIKFFTDEGARITVGEVVLKPFWLFGFLHIPYGAVDLIFPPWVLAYLLIAIPFVFLLKWMFNIY